MIKQKKHLLINQILPWFLIMAIPLVSYFLILSNRSPNFLRPLSISVRYSFNIYIFLFLLLFWGCFSLKGWPGKLISLSMTVIFFGLALAGTWISGFSDSFLVSGLLPVSDAKGYYQDALLLLNGQPYSVFSSRRPLFAGLLAVLLKLTGGNLQITIAILVFITAVSCYFAARAVRQTSGSLAASIFLVILFLFYRRFSGSTMSENLGVTLGALGFALLWSGVFEHRTWKLVFGIGVLTLGLIARAGPFFILIGIILWMVYRRRVEKSFSKLAIFTGVAVILCSFAINQIVFLTLGNKNGVLFTNFTYSFYGLVTGGQRWDAIYREHPEVFLLSEKEQPGAILSLTYDKFIENPMGPVQGIYTQYRYLVSDSWYNAYSYVTNTNDVLDISIQYALMILCLFGLLMGWLHRKKQPYLWLLDLMFFGILLSVPFVPPGDTNHMRAYAAVIPFFALLPAIGASKLLEFFHLGFLTQPLNDSTGMDITPVWACIIILFVSIIPITLGKLSKPISIQSLSTCAPGLELAVIQVSPGTYFNVHHESDFFLDWLPDFHQGRYTRNIHGLPYTEIMDQFLLRDAPVTYFNALDLKTNRAFWIVMNSTLLSEDTGYLSLCGNTRKAQGFDDVFFDVVSSKTIEP